MHPCLRIMFSFALVVTTTIVAACAGPPGPPGAQGPPGSSGSGGGPPYVWICTPARFSNSGSNAPAEAYVFNASSSTANVSMNILDKDGNNLVGHPIPGTSGPVQNYPGEANGVTVPLASNHTRFEKWMMPVAGGPGFDGVTNVSFIVRVVSDQPVVVATNFQFNPWGMPNVCYQPR